MANPSQLAGPKQSSKRHDIQGLRALAVLLVIADHAFAWPKGGFIGVDVFFVLSGFLMTSILFRELQNTGGIKFFAFYRRRIRRLIPAAAAVIGATVVASYFLFASGRFQSVLWDAASAFGFVSNWRFASLQTDYFNQGSATSPLQHFWSLSVEEQYYLIWPLALLALFVLAYKSSMRRVIVAVITLAITLLMFVMALTLTAQDPGTAYFITPARLWELSLGGVIALSMPLFDRVGAGLRPVLMMIGFAGILAAAFITPNTAGFPAPWSALAVLSTAMILAFPWQPSRLANLNPLTNRVSGYIGDISYSLYLWHFPAIILIAEAFRGLPGEGTPIPAVIAVIAAFGLAALSYQFIEEPVRKSSWLEPGRSRTEDSRRRTRIIAVTALAALTCVTVFAALTINRPGPAMAQNGTGTTTTTDTPTSAPTGATATLQTNIATALKATSWPELSTDPGNPQVIDLDPRFDKCSSFNYKAADCTWGDPNAPKTAVLVGDSIAAAYLPGLAQVLGQGEWKLASAALYACPYIDLDLGDNAAKAKFCADRKQTETDLVNTLKPDLLIVSNTYMRNTDANGASTSIAQWEKAYDSQLAKLDGSYKEMVFLAPPPYSANLETCYSPRTSPSACITSVSKSDYKTSMKMIDRVMTKHNGSLLKNTDWYCVDNRCPAFVGNNLVKHDTWHPSAEYVLSLVPVMQEALATYLNPTAAGPAGDTPATDAPATDAPAADGAATNGAAANGSAATGESDGTTTK